MVSKLFRDSQAQSSALTDCVTVIRTPQPQAFGSLNRVETLDSLSARNLLRQPSWSSIETRQ